MSEESNFEEIIWEYIWSSGDLNHINRLGRQGWEAVSTHASSKALTFGATYETSVSVLFKRRYFAGRKIGSDNEAGLKLKKLMDEKRSRD